VTALQWFFDIAEQRIAHEVVVGQRIEHVDVGRKFGGRFDDGALHGEEVTVGVAALGNGKRQVLDRVEAAGGVGDEDGGQGDAAGDDDAAWKQEGMRGR